MRSETGWLVFFFPRPEPGHIVPRLIAFGTWLGKLLKMRLVKRRVPYHVEGVVRTMDGVKLWGADAHAGFIGKPAAVRLAGLKQGGDYLVVALPTAGHRTEIQDMVRKLDGRPYEDWKDVLRVWRDGNPTAGDGRLFCSEAWVRILGQAFLWAYNMNPDQTDPLELLEASLRMGGGTRVSVPINWEA